MKRVLALLLCAAMILSVTACKKKKDYGEEKPTTTAPVTTTTTEAYDKMYSHNENINRFLADYLAQYKDLDVSTIRRHPEKPDNTVYLATINECNVTITDVSNKAFASGIEFSLQIDIEGGYTEKSLNAMLTAFTHITVVADTSCTLSTAEAKAEQLKELKSVSNEELRVCAFVRITHFSPIIDNKEMSVHIPCRMTLMTNDPSVIADAAN